MEFETYGPVDKLYSQHSALPGASKIKLWHILAVIGVVGIIGFAIWKIKSESREKKE